MTVIRLELRNMGATMALFCLTLVLLIIGSNAAGEFSVLHSPESLKFSGSSKLKESLIKEIFSACFGLSVDQDSDWNGLSIVDPFNTPEAIVEVHIEGVSNLGSAIESEAKNYHIIDDYSPDTFSIVSYRIVQHFNNGGNILTNIKLSEPGEFQSYFNVFGEIVPPRVPKQSLHHLKLNIEEDFQFLSELEALKAFINKVMAGAVNPDNIIDFFYFRFQSLHTLSDFHGPNSLQTKEAKKLLGVALKNLNDAFVKAYDGSVLVTAVCSDVAHTRRAIRAAPELELLEDFNPGRAGSTAAGASGAGGPSKQSGEQNDAYSGDYAAIFNIILWFGVVFSFTLVAIVYAIMDMDPGRDSIIYRMTSTRMKKDN